MSKKVLEKPPIQKRYQDKIVPALMKKHKLKNKLAVPRIKKVVINMGVSQPQDARARKNAINNYVDQLQVISGQKPVVTLAKKSISTYKLREGDPLGVMVILRGRRMWEFLNNLVSITLPRVKDFRGISNRAFDGHGNYSLGLEEQIVFSEIEYDKIATIKGLQINIVSTTNSNELMKSLLVEMGFPFEKETKKVKN